MLSRSILDFENFLFHSGFIDLGFSNTCFTWFNNHFGSSRIRARLNRVSINNFYIFLFPNYLITHLARLHYNHSPFLTNVRYNSLQNKSIGLFNFRIIGSSIARSIPLSMICLLSLTRDCPISCSLFTGVYLSLIS